MIHARLCNVNKTFLSEITWKVTSRRPIRLWERIRQAALILKHSCSEPSDAYKVGMKLIVFRHKRGKICSGYSTTTHRQSIMIGVNVQTQSAGEYIHTGRAFRTEVSLSNSLQSQLLDGVVALSPLHSAVLFSQVQANQHEPSREYQSKLLLIFTQRSERQKKKRWILESNNETNN